MIRLLEAAAAASGPCTAVETSERRLTYAELLDEARRTARGLATRGIGTFAVLESDAARVLALLSAAAWVGAEPCQYQPDLGAEEFRAQASALGHRVVVSRRGDLGPGIEVVDPDDLRDTEGADPQRAERPTLLIRTTGTTGAPKAARHDWAILERTVARVAADPEAAWLLAYGPHQFAGIQVLQHVVAARATLVAPFPRQPRDGLAALLERHVTAVSATPTYWRFLLAEARSRDVALPPLRQITLGGEAASDALLAELRRAFPDARIAHVYAATEVGSVVSVSDGRAGFSVTALLSETRPEAHLKVVEGELWVRAPAAMLEYADADADADVEGRRAEDEWRPTGDLVEVVGDRVLFRGRTTEIINVGGVKVSPLPVEERIGAVRGIAAVRVFGRPNPLTGAIVAAEVVAEPGFAEDELRELIRSAVDDLPRAWRPRSLRFVEAIETQGGKTVRRVAE
ncbi:MAG: class I adenylate-forming enzyme family protein [Marmoricola sp.]